MNVGKIGEDEAVKYLLENNFVIVSRNTRFGNFEIDIIANKNKLVYFIEVKTSSNKSSFAPEEYFSNKKISNLKKAAIIFSIKTNTHPENIRFDLIAIRLSPEGYKDKLKHYEDII
ncbi:endonuclease [Candidatus Parcubacteria bacterium]|nr:MAG: endonuclease [Candidatus Parcubacteria bacterium]